MTILKTGGKTAVTHCKKQEELEHLELLEIQLETGRTHPMRDHLSHHRYHVFRDQTYGGDTVRSGSNTGSRKAMFRSLFKRMPRQALHAKTLGFEHPATGEQVEFDSPLPQDFLHVLNKLRENCNINDSS